MIVVYTNIYMLPVIREINNRVGNFCRDEEMSRKLCCSKHNVFSSHEILNELDEEYVREYTKSTH